MDTVKVWACDNEGAWFYVGLFGEDEVPDGREFSRLLATYPEVAVYDNVPGERAASPGRAPRQRYWNVGPPAPVEADAGAKETVSGGSSVIGAPPPGTVFPVCSVDV